MFDLIIPSSWIMNMSLLLIEVRVRVRNIKTNTGFIAVFITSHC